MSEYINKADILSFIRKMECSRFLKNDSIITDVVLSTTECIKTIVSTMPPEDVQPVVHGGWRDTGSGQECSVCGEIQYGYDSGRYYCANCGAKMDKRKGAPDVPN